MVKTSEKGGKKAAAAAVNRGTWTAEEDQKLMDYVSVHGDKKWRALPAKAGLNRCGKSCRLRWLNYLRPGIKRGNISEDEEDLIIRLHNLLGNRWSLIAGRLPGRTDNEVKNHWNTHLSKRSLSIPDLNNKLNQRKPVDTCSSSGRHIRPTSQHDKDERPAVTGFDVNNSADVQEPLPRLEFGVNSFSPPRVDEEFDIDQLLDFAALKDVDVGGSSTSKLGLVEDYIGPAAGALEDGNWLDLLLDGVVDNNCSSIGWSGAAHLNNVLDGSVTDDTAGLIDVDYDDFLLALSN